MNSRSGAKYQLPLLGLSLLVTAVSATSCYSTGGYITSTADPSRDSAAGEAHDDGGAPGDDTGSDGSGPDAVPADGGADLPSTGVDGASHDTGDDAEAALTLVFSDEFDGTELDRTKWCTRYTPAGGPPLQVPDPDCTGPKGSWGTLDTLNDEKERFVDFNADDEVMHVVSGGTLAMRATKSRPNETLPYESAMLRSKFQFKPDGSTSYYVVSRVRLPNVIGTWPAFWLAGACSSDGTTQWPPEIDIFEGALNGVEDTAKMIRMGSQVRGAQTDSGAQEVTYRSQSFGTTQSNYYSSTSLRDVWVVIGALWSAQSVCYVVNGSQTMCENYRWDDNNGRAANPATLLLDLAIGGSWAGRYGIDDTMFPTQFEADYVRVYSYSGSTPPASLPN